MIWEHLKMRVKNDEDGGHTPGEPTYQRIGLALLFGVAMVWGWLLWQGLSELFGAA